MGGIRGLSLYAGPESDLEGGTSDVQKSRGTGVEGCECKWSVGL